MTNTVNAIVKFFDLAKGFGYATSNMGDLRIGAEAAGDFADQLTTGAKATLVVEVSKKFKGGAVQEFKDVTAVTAVAPAPKKPCVVKFYDETKGFGYVNIIGTSDDARVDARAVEAAGIVPGSGMVMSAVIVDDGRGKSVLCYTWSEEDQEQYELARRAMMLPAVGKFFNPKGGYGIVRLEDGREARVSQSVLHEGNLRLKPYGLMRVTIEPNRKNPDKLQVSEVRAADDGDAELMAPTIEALRADAKKRAEEKAAAKKGAESPAPEAIADDSAAPEADATPEIESPDEPAPKSVKPKAKKPAKKPAKAKGSAVEAGSLDSLDQLGALMGAADEESADEAA